MLKLENINVCLNEFPVLKNLNLTIQKQEIVGIVGESGSGKSMTALTIMDLLPKDIHFQSGSITLGNLELTTLDKQKRRKILGKEIGMVFQDPMNSLNPLYSIEHQISEVICIHLPTIDKVQCRQRVIQLLTDVQIENPEMMMKKYPHQFSGGQRQRIVIAMVIANNPKLLICDEATTALDVTVQFHILELLKSLSDKYQMSILVISHNLALIRHICHRVYVMYTGMFLENGKIEDVFKNHKHAYTLELLKSLPENSKKGEPIYTIEGMVPSLFEKKENCPFYPRCRFRKPSCQTTPLVLKEVSSSHHTLCLESEQLNHDSSQ